MSRDYSSTPSYKILILGSAAVGKTSLLKLWANKIFSTAYTRTLGVHFNDIQGSSNGKKLTFQFWDIPGQEFIFNKNMMDPYCDKVAAVCLMWDSSRDGTYEDLLTFLDLIKNKLSQETPIIFIVGKLDLIFGDTKIKALSKQQFDIKKRALRIGFKTVKCVRTSSKEAIGLEKLNGILLKTIHKPSENQAPCEPIMQNEYKPSLYQHTRQIRNQFISEIIKNAENLSDENFSIERVWLDMNLHSIKDTDSKTSSLIKQFLEKNPKKLSGNILDSNLIDENFAKKFHQAQDLLDLISKKETQIFGFKFVFSFFEETRKARRDHQHQEIKELYKQARNLYDSIFSEKSSTDNTEPAHNSNKLSQPQ